MLYVESLNFWAMNKNISNIFFIIITLCMSTIGHWIKELKKKKKKRRISDTEIGYLRPGYQELKLGGLKLFSCLNLASGYYQVAMKPEDMEQTDFTKLFGLFDFYWMPIGLSNSSSTFMQSSKNDFMFKFLVIIWIIFFCFLVLLKNIQHCSHVLTSPFLNLMVLQFIHSNLENKTGRNIFIRTSTSL